MADTLTLAGISVLGLVSGTDQVLLDVGSDIGSPTPDQATISSLLLDGDVITGDRYGNRTITLPFKILATSRANLSATLDAFLLAVSQKTWQMVWTPNGCPSTTWNCYRATPTVQFSPRTQTQLGVQFTVTFQAQPFGFSSAARTTTVNATGGPTSLQVDGMNSGSFTTGTLDTSTKYEGAGSCKLATVGGQQVGQHTITSVDLSSYASVSLRLHANLSFFGNVTLTLTDNAAHSASVTVVGTFPTTAWAIVYFNLTAFTGIDLTHIVTWKFAYGATGFTSWVDDLRAWPPASVSGSTAEGGVLTVPAILGSARTPVALVAAKASGAMSNVLLHSPPSSQDSDLTIFAGLSTGSVTVPDANMNYNGTYTPVVFLTSSATGTRTVTATFTQKVGATTVGTTTVSASVTGTQTLVALPEVALPITPVPIENVTGSLVIAITQSGGTGSDTYSDVALLDTTGQTVLLTGLSSALSVYADAPNPLTSIGPIYASTGTDRTLASSVANLATISGGPILFEPGNNKILAASTNGAPNVTVTYTPAWLHEATV